VEPTWKKLTQMARRAYARERKKEPRRSCSSGNICCHTQSESQVKARVRKELGVWRRTRPSRVTMKSMGVCGAGCLATCCMLIPRGHRET